MRLLGLLAFVCVLNARGDSWRAQRLEEELEKDPRNVAKILQLAAIKLDDASGVQGEADRWSALDEVQILYLRAQALDPQNVDALYHLGMVSWMKVFPAVVAARREAVMEPETPGPVRDRASRAVLNAKYRADIDYAIATLEQAIALDPSNTPAMSYLQMAYRARADFKDTRSEWDHDQSAATSWREKAYEVALTPPPAPPSQTTLMMFPTAIPISSHEMSLKLLRLSRSRCSSPAPVNLSAIIDRDGTVLYLEGLGDPDDQVAAAIEAAKNWAYQTTIVNGRQVMVRTTISVPCQ